MYLIVLNFISVVVLDWSNNVYKGRNDLFDLRKADKIKPWKKFSQGLTLYN
jgi:hypothetical protein